MPPFGNSAGYISATASFPDIVTEANVLNLAPALFTVAVESVWCALWLSLGCNWPGAMDVSYDMADPVCNH